MDDDLGIRFSRSSLQYAVENVFLPPQLPQKGSRDVEGPHETSLLAAVFQTLKFFGSIVEPDSKNVVRGALHAMQRLATVRDPKTGFLKEAQLLTVFGSLGIDDILPIHVKEQNAGVLMTREQDTITFEPFELLPRNVSVMKPVGRLKRRFPASSISINVNNFDDKNFQLALAHTIAKMSAQEVAQMKPKIKKAGENAIEDRDTTNPEIVTGYLAAVLSSMGQFVQKPIIWKNTREETLWSDALLPWRRSSLWLLIRVTLQLCFARGAPGSTLYKEFMVVFMASLLQASRIHELPGDIMYCMSAKISRRLLKMEPRDQSSPWLPMVHRILSTTRLDIQSRWQKIVGESAQNLSIASLSPSDIKRGTTASYPLLDEFIQEIHSLPTAQTKTLFEPRSLLLELNPDVIPIPASTEGTSFAASPFFLLKFESWVAQYLRQWADARIAKDTSCGALLRATQAYHQLASEQYLVNPEAVSIMILTIMELWMAADRSACEQHALLKDYDPEIPIEILQSLILPREGQMQKLKTVEEYVRSRRSRALSDSPSIYQAFGEEKSFAVRYFGASAQHQELKQNIEKEALKEREETREKFKKLKSEYDSIIAKAESTVCSCPPTDLDSDLRRIAVTSSQPCERCPTMRRARSMEITAHEWPLPRQEFEAQAAVFELMVPGTISDWRDLSVYVRFTVLGMRYTLMRSVSKWTLERYLSSHFTCTRLSRTITVASTTKPHAHTHRNLKSVALATEETVLLNNGMTYCYFDTTRCSIVTRGVATGEIHKSLTYTLSKECESLQEFLQRPHSAPDGLTANHVISRQSECPSSLTLAEFKAMATIPVGHSIQWLNIITALEASLIDLKKFDTVLILLQTAFQAGPPHGVHGVLRAGHQQFTDTVFAKTLLGSLSLVLERIRDNWNSFYALSAIISLGARVLAFTLSLEMSQECLTFLDKCRNVATSWLRDLQVSVKSCEVDVQRAVLFERIFHVAHVCVSSFDVDRELFQSLLADPIKAAVLLEASMAIQGTMICALRPECRFCCISMDRWRRLMVECRPFLVAEIVRSGSPALDDAIRKTWPGYQAGGSWTPSSPKADCWLTTLTQVSSANAHQLVIDFNLVSGELLINGRPLARLPAEIEKRSSYKTLFGKTMIETVPATEPGMQFTAKKSYHGYTVSFGLRDSDHGHLLVRASKPGEVLDRVPSTVFESALPSDFVDNHVCWYNSGLQNIEFRRKDRPWVPSPDNWQLTRVGDHWLMKRAAETLIALNSPVGKAVAKPLLALEDYLHIHITYRSDRSCVEANLGRLQLGFFLEPNSDKLQCRQFRGMYVEFNQDVGALVGLESRLVLRNDSGQRKILVPGGPAKWCRSENDHITVTIKHGTFDKVHAYDVDNMLGRLVDNGSLQSKLILVHLHALTSYCLPDPLTGNTGTEEALGILNSAAVRSFQYLTQENIDLLFAIAQLSPGRNYYPPEQCLMETTTWNPGLSFLSQSGRFYESVKNIFDQACESRFFHHEVFIEPPLLDFVHPTLHERHSMRAAVFCLSGYGAEHHNYSKDVWYASRDSFTGSDRMSRSYMMAKTIYEQRRSL
ncbi:hypothetical protein HIM_09566 [Hirsutella minnesotensis 3608]|uniref:ubiquitinyl hydrolase 1 n=1 Tax=Hirsutella minnesotensis 3608 TaxID=1043627 RepID=A0A0F8A315_9HYPO|nr:hypothetical protein HIM_09566 [Hirsutella minnesotensis 3608]